MKIKLVKKKVSIYKIYNFLNAFFLNEESSNILNIENSPKKYTYVKLQYKTILWSFTMLKTPLRSIRFEPCPPSSPRFYRASNPRNYGITSSAHSRFFHFPYSRSSIKAGRRRRGDSQEKRGWRDYGNRCRRKWHGGRVGVSHRVFSCSSHVQPAVVTPAKHPVGGTRTVSLYRVCCFINICMCNARAISGRGGCTRRFRRRWTSRERMI